MTTEPDALSTFREFLSLDRDVVGLSIATFAFSLGFQMTSRYLPAERETGGRVSGAYYLVRTAVVIPNAAFGGALYGGRSNPLTGGTLLADLVSYGAGVAAVRPGRSSSVPWSAPSRCSENRSTRGYATDRAENERATVSGGTSNRSGWSRPARTSSESTSRWLGRLR